MVWLILYIIIVIIAYILQRYLVISGKGYICNDDPQGISFIVAVFWPVMLLILSIWKVGEYIDKVIKSKVNG